MLHRIRTLVPLPLRLRVRELRRSWKRARVRSQQPRTRADLRLDLERLGVEPGDTLLVHSALSRLGFVVGGAEAVIDALQDAVGPHGTLCMPSFPFDTYVAEYLHANPNFDIASTPSRMGKITEVFRLRPGVQRSLHPTHPLAALGPLAQHLTHGHLDARSTFGADTPFHRLCLVGGRILLLGVDFHAMTNLHVVEDVYDRFPYRTYLEATVAVTVRDEAGHDRAVGIGVHDPALSMLRDCNKMEAYFRDRGVLVGGRVGDAEARLMSASGVLEVMTELADRGITMYDDARVPAGHRRFADRV